MSQMFSAPPAIATARSTNTDPDRVAAGHRGPPTKSLAQLTGQRGDIGQVNQQPGPGM
jgi:hypothetical protein